jgi:TetR/AcrR family transcriptional regulator
VPEPIPARDAILDAAEQLFARQGFDRTTIKQIGAGARVNAALLYYYFTDKETLYREMLQRLVGGFADQGAARLAAPGSPEEVLRRFVHGQVEVMLARPHLPRLLARELADHEARHAEQQILHVAAGMFARLCDVIRRGQSTGAFRPDIDPRFAAISTVAQIAWMLVARPAVGLLLGEGIGGASDETVRAYTRHVAEFTLAALRLEGAAAPPPSPVSPPAPTPAPRRLLSREDLT